MTTLLERAEQQFQMGEYGLSPNLLLYLPLRLKDSATFRDNSAYGHLVTRTGTLWTPQAAYYDGIDDNDSIPDSPVLDGMAQLSFGGWFKFVDGTVVSDGVRGHPLNKSLCYRIDFSTVTGIGVVIWTDSIVFIRDSAATSLNVWYHVIGSYDGASLKIYTNGVLRNSVAKTGTIANNANALKVGVADTDYKFKGYGDEICLGSCAFSDLKVAREYEETKGFYQ